MPSPRGRRTTPHEPPLALEIETPIDDADARVEVALEDDEVAGQVDYDAIDELPTDDVQIAIENDEPALASQTSNSAGRRREHEPPSDVCMQCGSTSFRESDCPHDEVAHIERTDRKTQEAITALQATWQARRRAERVLRRHVEGKAADGEASIEHTPSTSPVRERDLDVDLIARLTPSVPIVMTPLPTSTRRRRKGAPENQVMFAFATPAPAPIEQVEPVDSLESVENVESCSTDDTVITELAAPVANLEEQVAEPTTAMGETAPTELPEVATTRDGPIAAVTKPATRGRKRGTVRATDERPGD